MKWVREFADQGVMAVYDEAPGGGNYRSFDAPRNAPAKYPHQHLSRVYWHSNFFQYELAMPLQTRVMPHTALAGFTRYYIINASGQYTLPQTTPHVSSGIVVGKQGQFRTTDMTLIVHNLGYVPQFFVSYGGRMMTSGTMVQVITAAGGGRRIVSAFATSSIIGLRETAVSSASTLPAINVTYQVLVFRNSVATPGRPGMGNEGRNVILGRGKVDTSKQYLRRVLGTESGFDMDLGRTIDIKNGGVRIASGGNVVSEPFYNGSFAGSPYIPVGV